MDCQADPSNRKADWVIFVANLSHGGMLVGGRATCRIMGGFVTAIVGAENARVIRPPPRAGR